MIIGIQNAGGGSKAACSGVEARVRSDEIWEDCMRRIAFHLNCLEQGGAERVVTNLAHQFLANGYEVLIATEWVGENEFQIDPGIRRVVVGPTEEDRKKGRLYQILKRVTRLRGFVKREKPDVLIAFGRKANYRSLMSTLGLKTPVIVSVRTDPTGHYDRLADKIQIPLLFPHAAGFVFQTQGQKEFFPKGAQRKSRIILNPLNDKYIGVPRPQKRTKTVVQSGRLVDFKNQLMLIRAFVKVHEKHPDYDLKIYGGDSHDGTKELLEALIAEKNAGSFVKLMGASDELEKVLNDAAAYAFSSDWEGLPNALLEAMALGLPIVATDCPCGGPRTVIQDGYNGLLVPIMDEDAMAEGICRLIENPREAERMGENARKIGAAANGQAVFEQWRDYIRTLTGDTEQKGTEK